MPSVGPQGSRGGLMAAVVVFTMLFVISTIFALYFGVALTKETERTKQLTERSKLYYGNVTGPRFDELNKDVKENPSLEDKTYLGAAIMDSQNLANLVAGNQSSTTRPTDAIGVLRQKLADISTKLPNVNLPPDVSVVDALDALSDFAAAQQQLADQRKAQADDSAKQATTAIANSQIITSKAQQDVTDATAATQKALDDLQKQHNDYQAKLSQYAQVMDQERKSFNDENRRREIAESDLNKKLDLLGQELETARSKLAGKHLSPEEAIVRQADGQVLSVASDNVCYINLGSGDHIVPGMTFQVYKRQDGIPALGDGLSEENMPVGEGAIEVQQVQQDTSQCRMISDNPAGVRRINEGDLIANVVYDRNLKNNFVVYGQFNLSQSAHPTVSQGEHDRAKIDALVKQWGGNLQSKVNIDTDFVVMGAEPTVQQFTADELTDPFNVRQKSDEEAELKNYNDVITTARELHIPIMNQNRFLYFSGYFEQAQR